VHVAKFTHAFDVAEKIKQENFLFRQSREGGSPDLRRFVSAQRLAAFRFQKFQTDGFGIGAEFEGRTSRE